MSLYPGIAAVIDIDKLSSFLSGFGAETLHLVNVTCYTFFPLAPRLSPGKNYDFLHQI